MPIYEYACQTCGEEFEEIQKFSDPPLKRHGCSPKSVVTRKISLNAFQLKGGGWYNEGYSGKNGAAADKSAKSESASNGGGADKSANSDSGAKSESASKDNSGSDSGAKSESASKGKSGSDSEVKASPAPSTPKSTGPSQASG